MRKQLFTMVAMSLIWMAATFNAQAQDDPGGYMSAVNNAHMEMNQKYMAYMSAVSHGRRARKVEKLRQQALQSIMNSRDKTVMLPYYKGDNSLRKSSLDYITFCYNVFNEDYGKIVNMEEIAEQSIDQMEAYILLQEKTTEKIRQASDQMNAATREFAVKYNVKLIETKDELGEKMEKTNKVTHYVNKVYMLFFKCNFQDNKMVGYMNNNQVNDIEQARTALLKYASEGLAGLDSLRSFEGDGSLAAATRQLLQFYKKTAETAAPKMLDFYLKKDSFEKLKKTVEAKASRTKEDVDAYNAGVRDINAASNQFNSLNENLNQQRTQLVEGWSTAQKAFADNHMPYYKS